jgi:CBS domain-containing protein
MKPSLVRDLMSVGVPTCKTTTPVVDIARFLLEHNVEGMCVLDDEAQGVGVVGIEELIAAYSNLTGEKKENIGELTAEDIMREGMPTLQADMPIDLAAQFMRDQHTRIAYMTHNAAGIIYPAAYITYKHIVRYLAAKDENDLKDLGIEATRKSPIEQFMERRDEARRKAGLTK